MTLIVQVSDTHFDNADGHARRNALIWDHLEQAKLPIDLVLLTGDVAADGLPDEYAEAARRITDRFPVIAIPGNHDLREAFSAGLTGRASANAPEPLNQAQTVGGVRVIALDSFVPGTPRRDHGHLDTATLDFLDDQLGSRDTDEAALIALHHPPVRLGNPKMDPIRLDNAEEFAQVLARHSGIAGIVTGHAHAAIATTFAGLPLVIAPAVAPAFTVDVGEAVSGRVLPPGLAYHRIVDRVLTTEFRHLSS